MYVLYANVTPELSIPMYMQRFTSCFHISHTESLHAITTLYQVCFTVTVTLHQSIKLSII